MDLNPNTYILDYVDTTVIETVLTEIKMERLNTKSFKLPLNQQKLIEELLKRVEKDEASIDSVEQEAMEDADVEENDSENAGIYEISSLAFS